MEKKFQEVFQYTPDRYHHFFAPGRVNLIGEHLDYNGGLVMPMAIGLGLKAAVSFNDSGRIRIYSGHYKQLMEVDLLVENFHHRISSWMNYPLGVMEYFVRHGYPLAGCDLILESNLPTGAGLSSSAALEVLIAYIFFFRENQAIDRKELAVIGCVVENDFVGVNCGIMDQYAVANGKTGQAMLLDCERIAHEYVPFHFQDHALIIMNTCSPRALVDSAFNKRREECEMGLKAILQHDSLKSLCDAQMDYIDLIQNTAVRARARHVVSENQRVHEAAAVLKAGNLKIFGQLLNESHVSLRDDFEVSSEALDAIVEAAWNHNACLGARMTGAGFGGCAIALVSRAAIPFFKEKVGAVYFEKMRIEAEFYQIEASDGVKCID